MRLFCAFCIVICALMSVLSSIARAETQTEPRWWSFEGVRGMDDGTVVAAVAEWDPDGNGPETAQLVASGAFPSAGGVLVNNIARWNGSSWRPFGSGINGLIFALTEWDTDGDGPVPAQLVAGATSTPRAASR